MKSNIRNRDNELFGHERRLTERKMQRQQAIEKSKDICKNVWQNFCANNQHDFINDETINQLYDDILEKLQEKIQAKYIPFALFERKRFFEKINSQRKIQNLPPFPEPIIATRVSRPKNINDLNGFLYLSHIEKVVEQAIDKWHQKNTFSLLDCISWFLFSLASYAGYSDDKLFKAIFEYVAKDKPIYQLFKDMLCLPIKIESPFYANEIIEVEASLQQLYMNRLIIIDDISRLWLYKIQQQRQTEAFPKYHQVIKRLGEFTGDDVTVKSIHKSQYLKYVSIYWQTLINVRLDMQLVEVLVGNQNHTFITQEQFLRYFQLIKQPQVILSNDEIEKLTILTSSEPQNTDNNIQIFKSDIVKEIRSILNSDKKNIKSKLDNLLAEPLFANQKRLLTWVMELYVNGNKISTLKRYLSDIGHDFIAGTRDTNFIGWSKHNYQFVYDEILANKNQNRLGFTTTVICSLHNSLKRHFQAPDIDLRGGGDPQIISSYLIPNQLYQILQSSIANQQSISDYYKQILSVVIILLYRTGMRISEILGLQVKDIEYDNQSFSEYNIIVRSNAYRTLKSDDGTRRLCLSTLLLNDELEQFKKFFNVKRAQNLDYLFTYQYQSTVLSRHSIEQPIKKILANTPYHDIKLHSFRHNAISTMAVILRCDYSVARYFTDYPEDQLAKIKQHFLGKVRTISTNYWDALMEFAGHADLNTTFSSYIHTADIIASHQLQQAKLTLPLDIVNKLLGISRMHLYQHNKGAIDNNSNHVNLMVIRQYINRKIQRTRLSEGLSEISKKQLSLINQSSQSQPSQNHIEKTIKAGHQQPISSVFGIYSREMVEKLLHDIEDGQNLSEASSLNFNYDDALMIYERAVSLVQDDKGKLNHKLISKKRKQRSQHILIAPTPLHYHEEQALVSLCFDNLELLYQSRQSRSKIYDMLAIFNKKVNTSKSEIRFPFKEKKLFYKYLNVMCQILPSKYWRVNISALQYQSYVDDKGKRIIESLVDRKGKLKRVEAFLKAHPNFAGEVTTADSYNGYALSIISPVKSGNSRGSRKKNVTASALMKYVLHLLLIVRGLSD